MATASSSARFAHLHGLETALQRRVLFDVLAVFVKRGRADALNFAARQRGLEDVRRVDRSLRQRLRRSCVCSSSMKRMMLPSRLHLIHRILDALFKFAAVLCCLPPSPAKSSDTMRLSAQQSRAPCPAAIFCAKPFGHGAFAHARLADEHGVVLGAAGENLDDALDFLAAANHRIEFAVTARRQSDRGRTASASARSPARRKDWRCRRSFPPATHRPAAARGA